ncbi:hypothetical protein WDU94_010206 [Cyamophila willieti]
MASQSIVRLACFGVLLCALQVSALFDGPKVRWVTFDPTQQNPKFKAPLAQWDGKDLCAGNACKDEVRNTFLSLNDDFESEDFSAECSSADLPSPGVKSVCLLKQQRRSFSSGLTHHKTILEIQVYLDAGDKKCHARFSEPYEN